MKIWKVIARGYKNTWSNSQMIMTNITSKKLNIEFHEIDTKSDINRLLAIVYFILIIWTYEHLYSSIICRSLKICYQSKTIVDYLFHKKIHLVLRFFCWFFCIFLLVGGGLPSYEFCCMSWLSNYWSYVWALADI